MKPSKILSSLCLAAATVATVFFTQTLQATPYASGITNAAGTIKFFLNESNVTSIYVLFDNGTVSNNLSALGQTNVGVNSFSLGAHTNYQIVVKKTGSGVPSQISPTPTLGNSSTNLSFFGPRGVAVNSNPKDRYFGRIYVVNASPNSTVSGINVRASYKGLYALNPDYTDALGFATNSLPLKASFPVGGTQWWGSSTTFGPYRVWVGKDNKVYVGDSSGVTTTVAGDPVWMINPDLTTPIEMFPWIGTSQNAPGGTATNSGPCQTKPFVTGSLAGGDLTLTCMMYNYYATNQAGGYQSVLRYNIGSGPIDSTHVWGADPVIVVTNSQPGFGGSPGLNAVAEDLFVGPNGYVYVSYPRSANSGIAGGNNNLWVYDNNVPANLLWASSDPATGGVTNNNYGSTNPTNDCFVSQSININGVAVSADTNYIVFGNGIAANWVLVRLTNGIPDNSTITKYTAPNAINRSVAFDAADNVYTVEGNSDSLRVYSLGLTTTCITSNDVSGTNGSFQLIVPPTSVSVTAVTNGASQSGPLPGLFTISRAGQNLNLPLTVSFSLGGSATNYPGEYTISPAGITPNAANTIIFAANALTTNITIIPVVDAVARPLTTVILALAGGTGYAVSSPANATVFITNTATPAITITNLDAQMYERTNDYARFKVSRLGDVSVDLTGAVNISFGGTATAGTDYYYDSAVIDLPPGLISTNLKVYPIHNGMVTGPLTITATAASGTGYNVGTPASTGTVTVVDSDLPAETVLWSDSFSTDTSANWTNLFATTAGAPDNDFRINQTSQGMGTWPFDYSVLGIPSAPHSAGGATLGLYMTVNKDDATLAAAALNLYPIGQSFSGNYALRFDMFLTKNNSSGQTEYALFGINHSGTMTNWFRNSSGGVPAGWTFDGIFYDLEADGAALGDYVVYSAPNTGNNPTSLTPGRNASTLTSIFKLPPYSVGGVPSNDYGSTTNTWADVEISQVNGVITWKIDQTVIFSYTNTTPYTSGNIMLGYCDAFDSIGNAGASVIYANARVISLASPVITQITNDASNVTIKFNGNAGDVPGQFVLQSASVVNGPYIDVSSTITSPASGTFSATRTLNGPTQFYRIRRTY